ncbi:TAXI family TRAP transporter solute-binding subunit [Calditerricola satsumensis]|uniref:C4-dicarboxylate ABC transporter substrate-binding protein n=2 Tax=Calditerricola satsumensis TaxID=373054 RepID=A0A8J3FB14_9BACI|nr:TAXI family TRAP transporter solute-binding subunit [Calditerricola satsumensis]GGK02966.1 C4-dicarboxylate ABC transporter substrate-binding protein [Calditerricola satsumensis]
MVWKRFRSVMALLALVLAVAGCGSATQPGGNEQGADQAQGGETPDQLYIATGGTAGTYYALGGGIAKILEKAGVKATAQTTGASVENLRLLKDGQVDIAFTQADIADYAAKGTEMFQEGGAVQNMKTIAALYPETVQIVVPADSPVKSVADLKGKRVSVGAPGSGTELNAKQILEVYGLTFDDLKVQRLSFAESSSGLQDGTLDAAFVTAGTPTSAVSELAATKGVRIVSLDDEHIQKLSATYPFYFEQVIPAGTYKGQDQDVKTVAVKSMLVVRAELDDQLVYSITKTLFDNLQELETVHAKAKEIKLEDALKGFTIDVHPGAAKYFEEKGIRKEQ